MSIFYAIRNFFSSPGAPERTFGVQSGIPAYSDTSAATVTFDSAMQISAVWAAVRIISETLGSLPFEIYEKSDAGRKPALKHPLHNVLTKKPNRYMMINSNHCNRFKLY